MRTIVNGVRKAEREIRGTKKIIGRKGIEKHGMIRSELRLIHIYELLLLSLLLIPINNFDAVLYLQ